MEYTYQTIETDEGSVLSRTDSEGKVSWIPFDSNNSDYAQYLASLQATPPKATKNTVVEEPVASEEE
jgi:hypothetical protein